MPLLQILASTDDAPAADDDEVIVKETLWIGSDSQKTGSVYAGLKWLARSFMRVNFVFTLVAMMVRIILLQCTCEKCD